MLKFHRYFGRGAVIQRCAPVYIKGYADGEVTVGLSGGDYNCIKTVQPQNGKFCVEFPAVNDIESTFLLSAQKGEEKISVEVIFGDVYVTMGQSNMSYSLASVEDDKRWLEMAKKSKISILSIDEKPFTSTEELTRSYDELDDFPLDCAWRTGDDENLSGTSAISVQVAVYLWQRTGVPTGIVHTATGGLSVDAYLRRSSVESDSELVAELKREGRFVDKSNWNNCGIRNFTQTSCIWNERISPLKNISISGAVWYLGESSAWDFPFAVGFKRMLSRIIDDFHSFFGSVPFVTTAIAPEYYSYGDGYGYLYVNEALADLANEKEETYHVPTHDIPPRWLKLDGAEYYHPIHTVNKAPVSERICEVLRGTVMKYPRISRLTRNNGKLILKIDNVDTQLVKAELNGFSVAGDVGKYYPAVAKVISNDEIELYSEDVPLPSRATYAFLQYQDFCNARTIDGLPLLPFRSDTGAVNGDYYFAPPFVTNGADKVYENNFGFGIGTCRQVDVWTNGKIYRSKKSEIAVHKHSKIVVKAQPTIEDYRFFGVSPEICLCGHKNHLSDYKYLKFTLRAEGECETWGVVGRLSNGLIFRYKLLRADKQIVQYSLDKNEKTFRCDLTNAFRGDDAVIELSSEERKNVVELEFLFRGKGDVKVELSNIVLTDSKATDLEIDFDPEINKTSNKKVQARADTCLPT